MSRFIDRVFASGLLHPVEERAMRKASKIDVSNVVEYYYEHSGKHSWSASDFPLVAPPFQEFWIETRAPKQFLGEDLTPQPWHGQDVNMPTSWGFSVAAIERTDNRAEQAFAKLDRAMATAGLVGEARWILSFHLFMEFGRGQITEKATFYTVPVAASGRLFDVNGEVFMGVFPTHPGLPIPDTSEVNTFGGWFLRPMLLALTFMQARNVTMVDSIAPAALQKQRQRKGQLPLFTYKTLVIEPLKRVLATQGRVREVGLKQALHLCRGHWKVFDEKPLFGKHRGIWWWHSQVRGNEGRGVVEHDYDVQVN